MTFCVVAKTFYSSVAVCHHHRRRRRIVGFVELSNVIQSGRIRNSDEHFNNQLNDEQTKIIFKLTIRLIFSIQTFKEGTALQYIRISR